MEKERIKMEKAGLTEEDIKMLQQSLAAVRAAGIEMGVEDLIRAAKVLGQSGWSMEELERIRPPAAAPDQPKVTIDDVRSAMDVLRKKKPRPLSLPDISIPITVPIQYDQGAAVEEHMRKQIMQHMGIGIEFLKGGRQP